MCYEDTDNLQNMLCMHNIFLLKSYGDSSHRITIFAMLK